MITHDINSVAPSGYPYGSPSIQSNQQPLDGLTRKRLINIKDAIVAVWSSVDWHELEILTGCGKIIWSEDRLERSQEWGDDDYPRHVLNVLHGIVKSDNANEAIVVQYVLSKPEPATLDPKLHRRMQSISDYLGGISILESENVSTFEHLTPYIDRIKEGLINDHQAAIGAGKELVEAALKTFLDTPEEAVKRLDMPQLIKLARTKLGEDIPEHEHDKDMLKMLSNLVQIMQSVATLRNKYGTGHGRGPSDTVQLMRPYVALLANASISIATFLTQMHGLKTSTPAEPEPAPFESFTDEAEDLPW